MINITGRMKLVRVQAWENQRIGIVKEDGWSEIDGWCTEYKVKVDACDDEEGVW